MGYDFVQHLHRQAVFSKTTFGPGARTEGVLDHISKEIEEVKTARAGGERIYEWTDIVILALDGLLRDIANTYPEDNYETVAQIAMEFIRNKQVTNEMRDWPDWRKSDPNKAIEHVRAGE